MTFEHIHADVRRYLAAKGIELPVEDTAKAVAFVVEAGIASEEEGTADRGRAGLGQVRFRGRPDAAASTKPSNLRYRLKDLMFALSETALRIPGAMDHPFLAPLVLLLLVRNSARLFTVELDPPDALVLLALWRRRMAGKVLLKRGITRSISEEVNRLTREPLDARAVSNSLKRLGKLRCIELQEGKSYRLTESISFHIDG